MFKRDYPGVAGILFRIGNGLELVRGQHHLGSRSLTDAHHGGHTLEKPFQLRVTFDQSRNGCISGLQIGLKGFKREGTGRLLGLALRLRLERKPWEAVKGVLRTLITLTRRPRWAVNRSN